MEEVITQRYMDTARASTPDDILAKNDFQSSFWRRVFIDANEIKASDIHVENYKNLLSIRCRIKGDLCELKTHKGDTQYIRNIIIRLKQICRMDLSKNDIAQDKSISLDLTKSRYRIALSPTVFGENFVFRIIKDEDIPSLSNLHLPKNTEIALRDSINKKQGFICITGPTGSGKSTTLQSILMELDRKKKKVITIENPVERIVPYTMQKEISDNVCWKTAIKMALREDPDIILIGEIRDKESAELALEAAQTGHLVFSTLHTNDVAGIVDRLIGLGIENRLIAENLLFVSAQRLIQKLCSKCKLETNDNRFTRGNGCSNCDNSGIEGRLPVVEYSYLPDASSILHFDKKTFIKNELKTSLKDEIFRWINMGLVDENESRFWQ